MNYMKPTTCVVKMKNQKPLMAGSDSGNTNGGGSEPGGDSREYRSRWKDEE